MSLKNSIPDLIDLAHWTDPKLASSLAESFARFHWLLSSNELSPEKRKKALSQLNSYIKKKADELDSIRAPIDVVSLRQIRNELAHGKTSRDKDFSPLYPILWKAIGKLANRMGPLHIEDLLAYTLRQRSIGVSHQGASPSKVVAVYRPLFNALEPETKRKAFAELLLRLFSDPESMMFLDAEQ